MYQDKSSNITGYSFKQTTVNVRYKTNGNA